MRKGAQEPRIKVEPLGIPYTDAPDAIALMEQNGMVLYPWQSVPLSAWLARDDDDKLVYMSCGLAVPRQNGKNVVLEAREFYELAVCGGHVLHTAHRVKTAKKSFRRLEKYFTDEKRNPEAAALVDNIRYTNGEEAIYLKNGGYIEYVSRGRGTSRGFDDITMVVFDEAQELTDDQLEAIKYTLAASSSGDRQTIYTGTPPGPNAPGEVFTRTRSKAIGPDCPKRTCWHEWSVGEVGDVTDKDRWYATNPSLGYLLDEENTENELADSSPEGFARERLGWWSPLAAFEAVISAELWKKAAIEGIGDSYQARMAFGLKFSPDGSSYSLVGCKTDSKGNAAVETVEVGTTEKGTKGLAQSLYERKGTCCAIAVDGLSNTDAFCKDMEELKSPRGYVMRMKAGDIVAAASGFLNALKDGSVSHTGDSCLTDSATNAVKRIIGSRGGWGFGCDERHESTTVEAASIALWAVKNTKRNPKRKQRLL